MRQLVITILTGLALVASAPAQSATNPSEQHVIEQNLKDVHFAFDRYDLDDQARQALQADADWLKANPNSRVSIAGNADERGGIVYNLFLSDKRAKVTRDALVELGVPADRILFSTGWGKLYPVCNQSDESCWGENRRAHFTPGSELQTEVATQEEKHLPTIACATRDCK
jgi:peptidoglycan-associated lipoprotein